MAAAGQGASGLPGEQKLGMDQVSMIPCEFDRKGHTRTFLIYIYRVMNGSMGSFVLPSSYT